MEYCKHRVRDTCRLAASLAAVPKEQVPVTKENCEACQSLRVPTLQKPNAIVAILANAARANSAVVQPEQPRRVKAYDPNEHPCVHRSAEVIRSLKCRPCQNEGYESIPVHPCALHGECAIRGYTTDMPRLCLTCDDRRTQETTVARKITAAKGMLFNRQNQPADWLGDQFSGGSCVLVCGGPSVATMDLSRLQQRGVFVAAISEIAATHVRPHAWFSVDKCTTYHEAIWRDAQIMKFVARQLYDDGDNEKIPVKRGGQWEPGTLARKMPNVWFYNRGDAWDFDSFLERPYAMWCTTIDGKDHIKKSVMLVAIRLLHWLGFRNVYLIGCDFWMTREKQYAYPATKGDGAFRSNNKAYRAINETFVQLRPHFEASGFRVYNATPGGRLDAFERVTLDQAVDACLATFPKEIDVAGLYH